MHTKTLVATNHQHIDEQIARMDDISDNSVNTLRIAMIVMKHPGVQLAVHYLRSGRLVPARTHGQTPPPPAAAECNIIRGAPNSDITKESMAKSRGGVLNTTPDALQKTQSLWESLVQT